MRLQPRSQSKISLQDILKKKGKSLKRFADELGIVSYELIKVRCNGMGVIPPTEQEFNDAMGNLLVPGISSPTEGIIVISSSAEPEFQVHVDEKQTSSTQEKEEIQQKSTENQIIQSPPKKKKSTT